MTPRVDVAVIGGGINGCGIARELAGRGHSVTLFEMNDLGSATSAASTKLIHGGLRYLEHREFRLVREALAEREVIWAMAPHIVRPLRFVLPHHRGMRSRALLRIGLLLYDTLGGRRLLPPTRTLDLTADEAGRPLKPDFTRGFEYSDCWVEDSRLVVLNARSAADLGAVILPRTRVTAARRDGTAWRLDAETQDGERLELEAGILVNAAGPWVERVLTGIAGRNGASRIRLVRGSHIVTRRLFAHDRAYIFQNADRRIIFAIPYEGDFTLIGTTDRDADGDPGAATAGPDEIEYLCRAASEYFRDPVTPDDVVWTYAGVRPLYDDGATAAQEATRDYVLTLDAPAAAAPILSVFGGKITTYRRLAGAVRDRLAPFLPPAPRPGWTSQASLPGGDFPQTGLPALTASLAAAHPSLDPALLARLARTYGTLARPLLAGAATPADLGPAFGPSLTAREVDHLRTAEWAVTSDDILWRRTKLGLTMPPAGRAALEAYLRG